jgi:hypothetical protein
MSGQTFSLNRAPLDIKTEIAAQNKETFRRYGGGEAIGEKEDRLNSTGTRTATIESKRLVGFFLLTFAFTWLFWVPDALSKRGIIPASPLTGLGFLGAFGPLVAAIVLTAVYERGAGLIALFKKALDFRFGKRWWLLVMLLFPLLVLSAFLMGIATDGAIPPSDAWSNFWLLIPAFFSVMFLSGPFEEEFGWRGYALPRLQAKFTPIVSSLILGAIWAAWHIPQFLIPGNGMFYKTPFLTYVPTVIAATVFFTWVFNNTRGSLLAMLFLHTTMNYSFFLLPVLETSLGYVYVLSVFAVAAIVVLVLRVQMRVRLP